MEIEVGFDTSVIEVGFDTSVQGQEELEGVHESLLWGVLFSLSIVL